MVKVVFPLEGLNPSGGLRVVTSLANFLAANDFDVDVIVPDYASTAFYEFSQGVNLITLKTIPGPFARFSYLLKLVKHSSRSKYKIAFATGYKTPIYIYLSKIVNASSTELVYIIQHYEVLSQVELLNDKNKYKYNLLKIIANIGYLLPLKKIAVSGWIREKVGRRDIDVIPNGIDLTVYKPSINAGTQEPRITIGIIGTNKKIKGFDTVIEALRLIDSEVLRKVSVLILTQEELQVPEFFEFEIFRARSDSDIAVFYQRCTLFVFASLLEGFGLPPIEAMACGTPVICSKCGGVDEFLTGDNALVFDAGDPSGLADQIARLIGDAELRARLSGFGLDTSRNFSSEMMLSRYLTVIRRLINMQN